MKILFRLIVILLVLLVVGAGLLWFALPTDRIGRIASDRLEAATGRTLTLSGEFTPSLWPNIGVTTGPLAISNAEWAEEPVFVSAQGASVAVDLMALIGGDVRIVDLTLDQPVIQLERAADGRTNWTFETAETTGTQEPGGASAPAITELSAQVLDGRIRFVDGVSGTVRDVQALNVSADITDTGRMVALDGAASIDGIASSVVGTARFAEALAMGAVTLDMAVETDLGTLSYVGDFTDIAQFDGILQISLPNPNAAMALAGLAPLPAAAGNISNLTLDAAVVAEGGDTVIEGTGGVTRDGVEVALFLNGSGALPDGPISVDSRVSAGELADISFSGLVDTATLGVSGPLRITAPSAVEAAAWGAGGEVALPPGLSGPVQIAGFLDANPTRAALSDARIAVGDLDASGRVAASLAGRPRLDGDLTLAVLDLDRFTSGDGAESAPSSRGEGWPTDPLPYDLLDLADADLSLDVGVLRQGNLELGRTRVGVRLNAGDLRLDIQEANGFGGVLTGAIGVNGPSQSIDIDLSLGGVRLERVLGFVAGTDRLEGQAALAADLTARGSSINAIMQSLTGQIRSDMADGALKGVNLAALARNFTDPGGSTLRTDFTEAAVALDITNGTAQVSTLSALGPLIRLAGEGIVAIGAQSLDLTLRPRIVGDLQGQGGSLDAGGITLPVLVTGPWSDLSFRPDLSALEDLAREEVKAEVDEAIDNAVDDARDRVEERLQEELGSTGEGSVEDQLRDGLENRLREGLGSIFR
ncbi:AsmA family protein [Pontivivens insulae]|uniref:AsmA domain-containing protein n=1 Tax=Pontivivens insulae TaxID=1639689 RepID=A0A2R8ACM8_9RHOB|nr:AsmA family protein [Pontivivens insulae]RED13927.1 uncharacterized protein involved in outer membrane biogenesis [Pontivivens insulae]SPF30001.1 hypothetical protein POI8812_02329 [Pontivivens insulae]